MPARGSAERNVEADCSLELGAGSPALELPWQDPEGRVSYVALRDEAGLLERNLDAVPEAQSFPALRRFLLQVNSRQSAWQSAKCDAWADETNPDENLYDAPWTHNSYVDLVLAAAAAGLRPSLKAHQQWAEEMVRAFEADERIEAYAEIVVRRCYFHPDDSPDESDDGYCLTLFLIGYGATPADALDSWSQALEAAAQCLLKMRLSRTYG